MRLGPLILATVLIALAVAPAATADKPIREVHPSQEDGLITDQCAFPVLGHIDGPEIITTFTDKDGNPVKQIVVFPGNTLTFTNVDTGKSVTILGTGSFQRRANPDGSEADKVIGQGFFSPNPVTGEPGIWDLNGHASATFDADGNLTSVEISGQLVDLCPQLAS
jgi:hypothetical protein